MQVCTYSEFTFAGIHNALSAFVNMGKGRGYFGEAPGLEAIKPMGTGGGNGFSIFPNFKCYALFGIWNDLDSAEAYFDKSQEIKWYFDNAAQSLHLTLQPVKVHGLWNGSSPFRSVQAVDGAGPVAVLTRATIKKRHLPEFWFNVPEVSKFMSQAPGILHRLGIGEYPLFMQATFSVWESRELLYNAAYRQTAHADVVKKTREKGWYAEELFAQFKVLKMEHSGGQFAHLSNHIKT